ncbi:hypothetical protein DNTS_035810 [Danionella cerebrum]|uniref:Cilia- and flagella-associated protein 206 n=1 Tax=Danionella cerebrum TaxID=2873325 RepID=A0A553Q3C5_9TELE|nr:hypothetical protein DNTS_035810 [Danionella translucida]
MSSSQAESVIRNIIREIAHTCTSRGETLSETLIAFMVKAVVLDPRNNFNVDHTLTKEDVQKLIELCVERLMDQTSPTLQTIKMQVYFDMNYTTRREFMELQQKLQESRVSSLSREITDFRAKSREEMKSLYGKIVSYVIQRSDLGSSTDITSVRETTVPDELNEVVPAVVSEMEADLSRSRSLSEQYTTLVKKITADPASSKNLTQLQQSLYNALQHQTFLRILLGDVIQSAKEVTRLQSDLNNHMTLLREAIHSKTTVPTAHPHFSKVAALWAALEAERLLVSLLSSLALGLRVFLRESVLSPDQIEMIQSNEEPQESDEQLEESEMRAFEWCFPGSTPGFQDLPLQYQGFCGYTLIHSNGLVLPGDPNIGVLKHREKFYCFSSRSAAYAFASRADECLSEVLEKAKRTPELIQLLQLHREFNTHAPYSESEAAVQTETHPLESNIVKSYEWNEWELRRKAIRLANLQSKITRSTQSDLSHMRRHNSTQTFLPKEAASQTQRSSESNVPRPQMFLSGLRGTGRVGMVDLTRALRE